MNKEQFKAVLEAWGVEYEEDYDVDEKIEIIRLKVGNKKVVGYWDFVTEFNFDQNGNFKEIGIWE